MKNNDNLGMMPLSPGALKEAIEKLGFIIDGDRPIFIGEVVRVVLPNEYGVCKIHGRPYDRIMGFWLRCRICEYFRYRRIFNAEKY